MFGRFLRGARISTKFNVLLTFMFAVGILLSGAALSSILEGQAQSEVAAQASLLIEMSNSFRHYTLENVNPLLMDEIEQESVFIPAAIPAFSARESVEILRKQKEYEAFLYKDAMLNPTNLRDKADGFETSLIETLRAKERTQNLSGFRDAPGGKFFYIARPLVIQDNKCLRCHGFPEEAPKSQIATYGADNGFGWKLNEVLGAQIVSVPASAVFERAQKLFGLGMSILAGIFAVFVFIINYLMKRTILEPIRRLAREAEEVSMGKRNVEDISVGKLNIEFDQDSKDEIQALSKALKRMRRGLSVAKTPLNQRFF